MPKPQRIDLTDKKALVSAFKKHHQELWASFGTAPLYKDYDVNKVIEFINSIIEKEHVHISPEKKDEIFSTLQKYGNNSRKALQYIGNVFLKGAGLGLNEHQEKLLRNVIREEILNILKEDSNFSKAKFIKGNLLGVVDYLKKLKDDAERSYGYGYFKYMASVTKKSPPILAQHGIKDKKKAKEIESNIEKIFKEATLKEADHGIKFAEKQWNDHDSMDEKEYFFKKFRGTGFPWNIPSQKGREEIMGKSFKELSRDVQKAWEYYLTKMK